MNYDPSKINFADKLTVWNFDAICKKYEVRCLRNNIYQSVIVKDFDHLLELWFTHPKYYFDGVIYCKDPLLLLKSVRYIFRDIKRRNFIKGKYDTFQFLFSIYIDMNENELISDVKKHCTELK